MLQKAFGFVELEFQMTVPKMMKYIFYTRRSGFIKRIKKFQKVR